MWTKFRRLSPRERRLFLQAWVMLPIAAIRVRLSGAASFLDAHPVTASPSPSPPPIVGEAARMVSAAARYGLLDASCLPRSIVLQRLLRREGILTDLRVGVRKADGLLDGHAWVEYHGVAVSDAPDVHERFTVLSR